MSNLGGTNVSEDTDKDANGHLQSVVAGTNITSIDNTDPVNPVINAATQAGVANSGAVVTVTADLTSLGNTSTAIPWETEESDDNDFIDIAGAPTELTVPTGVTRVNISAFYRYTLVLAAQSVGMEIARWNSSDVFQEYVGFSQQTSPNGGAGSIAVTALNCACVAGDYFTVTHFTGDTAWTIIQARASIQDVT